MLSVQEAISDLDAEIIVVDNNSQDGSCAMVKECFPDVTLIENKENVGFSKANNQAAAVSKGEYICILNPDTAVQKDTFIKVIAFAKKNPDFGAVGVKYIDGTGNFLPESKRNLPTLMVSLNKMLGITSKKKSYYANHIGEDETGKAAVLAGAFMLMKKSRYDEVGGFDEDYFMYGEDIDLSYKLIKSGYSNYYFGETAILHYKGESTTKDGTYLKRFYGAMRIFYKKHFRNNPITGFLVYFAVSLARFANYFRFAGKQKPPPKPDVYYLLSDNMELLENLSKTLQVPLKSMSKQIVTDGGIFNSQLIFDAECMTYTEIFKVMQTLKNKENTFRIKPVRCQFIIGSDTSNEKGGVVRISD